MVLAPEKYIMLDCLCQAIVSTPTKKNQACFNVDIGMLDFILKCHHYHTSAHSIVESLNKLKILNGDKLTFKGAYILFRCRFSKLSIYGQ